MKVRWDRGGGRGVSSEEMTFQGLSLPVAVRSHLSETQGDALSFRRDANSGSEMRESQRMLQSVHI